MGKLLNIGDWVTSYSKGIFRVEKIIDRYYDECPPRIPGHTIGDKYSDRIIVSKRLLNSKYKKSLGYDSCSEYFVTPLTALELTWLDSLLTPDLLNAIDNYSIPAIQLVFNIDLKITDIHELKKLDALIKFIKVGRTYLEIDREMERTNIKKLIPETYGNYLFQLINFDYEYLDKRQIWRDAKSRKK